MTKYICFASIKTGLSKIITTALSVMLSIYKNQNIIQVENVAEHLSTNMIFL